MGVGSLVYVRAQQEPITPLVYEIIESTTPQTTVVDVVVGASAIVVVIGAVAVVLGLSFGGVLLMLRKLRGQDQISAEGSGAIRLGLNSTNR